MPSLSVVRWRTIEQARRLGEQLLDRLGRNTAGPVSMHGDVVVHQGSESTLPG